MGRVQKTMVVQQMKIKIASMEWLLKQIVKRFSEAEEYQQICSMVKLTLTVPVKNTWPERGGSVSRESKHVIGAA